MRSGLFYLVLLSALWLAGCAAEQDDLRAWMAGETAKGVRARLDPLPELRHFPAVEYEQGAEVDPFRAARISPETRMRVGGGPDMSRPREPLESFPLESMDMVGTLMQDQRTHALVDVGGRIHQVAVGNYLGQDHGLIASITESEITLTEIVEDINGDWVERTSRVMLRER